MESIHGFERTKYETTINPKDLLGALKRFGEGDFTVHLESPDTAQIVDSEIVSIFNKMIDQNNQMMEEFQRVNTQIGTFGQFSERASLEPSPTGGWKSYPCLPR